MKEFFRPDQSKEKEGKRFVCNITDREPIIGRDPGTKRFQQVLEDFTLGIRVTVEGDTLEEVRELALKEGCDVRN